MPMDQNKLERLEAIRKYLEKDDQDGLNRFLDKIGVIVKKDEDFQDIIAEVRSKNFEQALFLTEDIIYEIKESDMKGDFEDSEDFDAEEYTEEDEFLISEEESFDDINVDSLEDMTYYEDKEDDDLY